MDFIDHFAKEIFKKSKFHKIALTHLLTNLGEICSRDWQFKLNCDSRFQRAFTGVTFIKVKCTNFLYDRHFGSFYHVHVTRENLPKWRLHKKIVRLMLMKLTLACSCVLKEITLVGSNHGNYFENATACSKRELKTRVAALL